MLIFNPTLKTDESTTAFLLPHMRGYPAPQKDSPRTAMPWQGPGHGKAQRSRRTGAHRWRRDRLNDDRAAVGSTTLRLGRRGTCCRADLATRSARRSGSTGSLLLRRRRPRHVCCYVSILHFCYASTTTLGTPPFKSLEPSPPGLCAILTPLPHRVLALHVKLRVLCSASTGSNANRRWLRLHTGPSR